MYKRVLVKLSGEALGEDGVLFNFDRINRVASVIAALARSGVQVAVVIGGGNIWRGRRGPAAAMNAVTADHMGMLGTVINSLAMQDALDRVQRNDERKIDSYVMTAIDIRVCAEPYNCRAAVRHLEMGHIVLFAYGTGDPLHSTDTAAAQRAVEIEADALLLAKNVDGIYTKNPSLFNDAKHLKEATYDEALALPESGIDTGALLILKENRFPEVRVFSLKTPENILRVIAAEKIGTTVRPGV